MKKCSKCGIEKNLGEYYSQQKIKANGDSYTYYPPDCKECTVLRTNKWQVENRERSRESKRKHANTPEGKIATKERSRRASERGTRKKMVAK